MNAVYVETKNKRTLIAEKIAELIVAKRTSFLKEKRNILQVYKWLKLPVGI